VAARPGAGLPPINDITTDRAAPPAFAADPAGVGRDMSYPAEFAAGEGRLPDLAPIRVTATRQALASPWRPRASAGRIVVTRRRHLSARETTKIFRFVDDVVVRVRADASGGATVDVRSKSRDGRGDLGANAARIRRFAEKLPR
jgi:hypothetical protein